MFLLKLTHFSLHLWLIVWKVTGAHTILWCYYRISRTFFHHHWNVRLCTHINLWVIHNWCLLQGRRNNIRWLATADGFCNPLLNHWHLHHLGCRLTWVWVYWWASWNTIMVSANYVEQIFFHLWCTTRIRICRKLSFNGNSKVLGWIVIDSLRHELLMLILVQWNTQIWSWWLFR